MEVNFKVTRVLSKRFVKFQVKNLVLPKFFANMKKDGASASSFNLPLIIGVVAISFVVWQLGGNSPSSTLAVDESFVGKQVFTQIPKVDWSIDKAFATEVLFLFA